jgi:hypothetical protein
MWSGLAVLLLLLLLLLSRMYRMYRMSQMSRMLLPMMSQGQRETGSGPPAHPTYTRPPASTRITGGTAH